MDLQENKRRSVRNWASGKVRKEQQRLLPFGDREDRKLCWREVDAREGMHHFQHAPFGKPSYLLWKISDQKDGQCLVEFP